MNLMLFFSPHWYVFEPPLGIPYITGYLKSRGKNVKQRDLNLEAQDYFLSKKYMEECLYEIKKKDNKYQYSKEVINKIERCKANVRSSDISIIKYLKSIEILEKAYMIISDRWCPTKISFSNFNMLYSTKKSSDILMAIKDSKHNPFINFYSECVLSKIDASIDIIGISIIGEQQLIPGFTLAYMIRKKYPQVKIVLGGTVFTILRENIERWKCLFDLFDFIILYEGEETMYQLISSLESNKELSHIGNLIYKDKTNKLIISKSRTQICLDLDMPCFDGFNLDGYFSPGRIIPFGITRQKCIWDKCAFCVHDISISNNFKVKSIDKIIDEMIYLKKMYNTDTFDLLIENALDENYLETFGKELINKNAKIKWRAHFRLQKKIDFNLLKRSGCVALFCGVESGSDNMLKRMIKGTNIRQYEICLKAITESGIWSRISLIIGFPGETLEDVLETFKFLMKNKKYIGSIGGGKFILYKNSFVYNNPKKYNIEILKGKDEDMAIDFNYKIKNNYNIDKMVREVSCFKRQIYVESIICDRIPGTVLFKFLTRYNSAQEAKEDFLKCLKNYKWR